MRIILIILILSLTSFVNAQYYRYSNQDCNYTSLTKNPYFNEKQIETYLISQISINNIELSGGEIFLLIYINEKGQSCCNHILNLTNYDLTSLNLFEIISNLPKWTPATEKKESSNRKILNRKRKIISYSTLHIKFGNDKISVDTTSIDNLDLRNGYSIGDVEIENKNFRESSNKPQVFCEVFNKSNSKMPWDLSRSLSIDNNGIIWCGTDNGLLKVENYRMTVLDHLNSVLKQDVRSEDIKTENKTNSILCSAVDSSDNKWFSDGYNLYKYNNENWTVFDTTFLPVDWCTSISCDKENVFFATYNGILKENNSIWEVYDSTKIRIPSNTVYDIFLDSKNNTWISTKGGNLCLKDSIPIDLSKTNSPLNNQIFNCAAEDNFDNIWFGLDSGGLTVRSKDGEWTTYNILNSNIPGNTIWDIAIDKKTNLIWLSIPGVGIVLFNDNEWFTFTPANSGVPSIYIPDIDLDKNGEMWAATFAGLLHIRLLENNTP